MKRLFEKPHPLKYDGSQPQNSASLDFQIQDYSAHRQQNQRRFKFYSLGLNLTVRQQPLSSKS
jgi:hypothetical protein